MPKITKELVRDIIKKNFSNKKFTTGDILYSVSNSFSNSLLGTIRMILVNLTKEDFLDFNIELRGSPHYNSEKKRNGATYWLKK